MIHTHVMWAIIARCPDGVSHDLLALLPPKWAVLQRPAASEKSTLGSARYLLARGRGFILDSGPPERLLYGSCNHRDSGLCRGSQSNRCYQVYGHKILIVAGFQICPGTAIGDHQVVDLSADLQLIA